MLLPSAPTPCTRRSLALLLVMAGFMLYGFLLIYLRDFAPDKDAWVASYSVGKHFESRLAHVHGALFSLLNLALGFVLARLGSATDRARRVAAGLGLAGLLMPVGILGEVYLGLSPIFVLLGALSMTAAVQANEAGPAWIDGSSRLRGGRGGGWSGGMKTSSWIRVWAVIVAAKLMMRHPSVSASRLRALGRECGQGRRRQTGDGATRDGAHKSLVKCG